jgi:hypothetical protein
MVPITGKAPGGVAPARSVCALPAKAPSVAGLYRVQRVDPDTRRGHRMSRARTARALLAAGAAGVGALVSRRRRRSSDDWDDAAPAAAPAPSAAAEPAPAGGDAVMTYSSPGQVAAFEDVHGGGGTWAASGGMTASPDQAAADGEEPRPQPPDAAGA